MQLDLLATLGDARRVSQAEQLLQAHGEDRRVFTVVEADTGARRHSQVRGRPFVQALGQRPGQQITQDRRQVQGGEMAQPGHFAQIRLQPVFQAGKQRLIAQVGPLAVAVFFQVELAQQRYSRLPLAQLWRPVQQVQAFAPHQA
ncbi:hypothetical protein D3C79_908970 [compost metagenome]